MITLEKHLKCQANALCLSYSRFGDYGWLSTVYMLKQQIYRECYLPSNIGYSNELKNDIRFSFIYNSIISIQHHGKYICIHIKQTHYWMLTWNTAGCRICQLDQDDELHGEHLPHQFRL